MMVISIILFSLSGLCFFGAAYTYIKKFSKGKVHLGKRKEKLVILDENILIHTTEKIELYTKETDWYN